MHYSITSINLGWSFKFSLSTSTEIQKEKNNNLSTVSVTDFERGCLNLNLGHWINKIRGYLVVLLLVIVLGIFQTSTASVTV